MLRGTKVLWHAAAVPLWRLRRRRAALGGCGPGCGSPLRRAEGRAPLGPSAPHLPRMHRLHLHRATWTRHGCENESCAQDSACQGQTLCLEK